MILTFTLDLPSVHTEQVFIDGIEHSKASAVQRACEILQAVAPDLTISATREDFQQRRSGGHFAQEL